MNIVKKKPPRINFNKQEEEPPVEKVEAVAESPPVVEEAPKEAIKMEIKENKDIFNTVELPKPKTKKKRVLSQKQLDHLARCREKALEKKKAMKALKEQEKEEKKALKQQQKEEREEKLRLKKQNDAELRKNQAADKRRRKKEMMFECLDEWYAKKQEKKKSLRTPKPKAVAPKAVAQAPAVAPTPKFRNEWKDPFCNSKFSPFNPTFNRKKTRRGYMNY